ncbi:class II 3-deoxy-7-phosphoheptulonate synthase [Streptomyces capillispiralis]|uniref:Phospho-2-dehydro-3-deoxyheptonate aldolase n=1 Tax=Streptomyces capillispiralis TaxID=68182 RepID=A0A561TCE5_9ACTN|nr:3-deoxy-7-phosphoheptulonate synthase class II [Streptomyces capillispiralis]TWF84743.1 3-deoxy-D-arabinoheptulosonate-7-phosphate synthase [Streptomyces capillispiralis]GHH95789.1 phospho-2-dehydro-3-deoxyheptonate aldolase [Streptomyces capillispiralis]
MDTLKSETSGVALVNTWSGLPAAQRPDWPDPAALHRVTEELAGAPPLVFADECDRLRDRLAAVARGEALLLQGGDCAETFAQASADSVHRKLTTMMQMAAVLTYAASVPVVKVGRLAGQYAKPRSQPVETRDGVTLPTYRGDAVNGFDFTAEARVPDPERLLRMYRASSSTLNAVRAFTARGHAGLSQVHEWNRDFIAGSPLRGTYETIAAGIDRALHFMRATGARPDHFDDAEFYVSHEGLLLDYEGPLTRRDPRTGRVHAASGHMLWIGERTRDLDGAHVEYFSRIDNPIGVKLGPTATPDTVLRLIDRLDPDGEPGRLTFVVRLGADRVRDVLPDLVEKATASGARVAWVCDPMHGNTMEAPSGHKTRRFDDILAEVRGFFEVHRALGTHAGGIHVELTGDDVTECVGGGHDLGFPDLFDRYESACDPRLNRGQSLDLAFLVAEFLHGDRPVPDGPAA